MNKAKHALSTVILVLIVLYGILRIWFLNNFAAIITSIFNSEELILYLNKISKNEEFQSQILGWVIYYPSYLFLHLIFIFILFKERKKIRNVLSFSLVLVIALLVLTIIVAKQLNFHQLYKMSYDVFQNLFGLPFILLAIEGGRILYNDVNQLVKKK